MTAATSPSTLNIVIPMAGAGSRFARAGYTDPKPLIPIHGKPMIGVVVENLTPSRPHRFVFICQAAHVAEYGLKDRLDSLAPGCAIVEIDGVTDGAARTVLAAAHLFDNEDELMIANSDQFVDVSIDDYLAELTSRDLDGLIMTMTADDPKWSFVGLDPEGLVTSVVEKQVISHEATVGIYNFRHGSDFVAGAEAMIDKQIMANGEYYVAPVYNELIAGGARVGVVNVGSDSAGMYGLGTPDDLDHFLSLDLSRSAAS